jgi:hypothetical protein
VRPLLTRLWVRLSWQPPSSTMRLGCRWIGGLAVWFQQRKRLRPPAVPGLRSRNSVSSCGRSNDWVGRERAV